MKRFHSLAFGPARTASLCLFAQNERWSQMFRMASDALSPSVHFLQLHEYSESVTCLVSICDDSRGAYTLTTAPPHGRNSYDAFSRLPYRDAAFRNVVAYAPNPNMPNVPRSPVFKMLLAALHDVPW